MKVLIVGAAGFVGRHLTANLTREGKEVVASSSKDGTGIDPRTGLIPADFAIPPGIEAIFYLAQSPFHRHGFDNAVHLLNVSAVSATRLAALAVGAGVKRLVYASTGSVYAHSFAAHAESSPVRRDGWYELSKVHAEEALALFRGKLDVTVIRLFGVYGPGQSGRLIPTIVSAVESGKPVHIERNPVDPSDLGGLRISLCYIDDLVRIMAALLTQDEVPILNVAGEEVFNVRQIATAIGRELNRHPLFEVTSQSRAGDLVADISLLRQLVGPRFTAFEVGLRHTLGAGKP